MTENFRAADVAGTNWQNRLSPRVNNAAQQNGAASSRDLSIGGGYPHIVIDGQTQQPSQQVLEAREFMTAMRSFGEAMRNFANDFLARSQNIFDSMLGTSSDEEAVSVTTNQNGSNGYTNGYTNGNDVNDETNNYPTTISVSQLATNQQNTGDALNTRALNSADIGQNDFTIERGGNTYNFSINISETSSNRTLQQMMADEINSQTSGVVANVYVNEATEQTTLELTALTSGSDNAFTIADVPGYGNAVAATGIDSISVYAQDAVYTVNDEVYTSPTNTINVGDFNVSLQSVTYEPVEISTAWDVTGIAGTIQEMVGYSNDIRQYAMDLSAQDSNADALRRRVDDIYFDNEPALQDIGITRDTNGSLQVDEAQLQYAIESGTAEAFLSDQTGYTGQMARLGDMLTNDPAQLAMRLNLVTI